MKSRWTISMIGICISLLTVSSVQAADSLAVSAYAPIEILGAQVESYAKTLEKNVKSESSFDLDEVRQNGATLATLALTLGMSDEEAALKKAAPVILKAAEEVVKSTNYAEAKKAVTAVKNAMDATSDEKLEWQAVGDVTLLMRKVPLLDTRLRREVKKNRADQAVVLAAIGQVCAMDTSVATTDEEATQWTEFSRLMRDRAATITQQIQTKETDDLESSLDALSEACDTCHEVFQK